MSEPHSLEPVVLLNEVFPGHTNSMDTLYGGTSDVNHGHRSRDGLKQVRTQ